MNKIGWELERGCAANGYKAVCGIDEAGRGPLAGPVYAASVILPDGIVIDGLDDSKKLSEKRRNILFDTITKSACSYAIASANVSEIEEINILNATLAAMKRAVNNMSIPPDFLLVDGNTIRGFKQPAKAVIGGDGLSASIAAASILAKVSRDRYMTEIAEKHPEYGFEKHKGYGTAAHIAAIRKHGPSPVHRMSFLSKILSDGNKHNTGIEHGRFGEHAASAYLCEHGYKRLAENYKSRWGEIDLIAQKDDIVAFVEVKLRKNADFAQPLEHITVKKTERIKKTALMWLSENPCELQPRFDVIEIFAPRGMKSEPERIVHIEDAFR